jgi:hypothetical protein
MQYKANNYISFKLTKMIHPNMIYRTFIVYTVHRRKLTQEQIKFVSRSRTGVDIDLGVLGQTVIRK